MTAMLLGTVMPGAHAAAPRRPRTVVPKTNVTQSIIQISFNNAYAPVFVLNWGSGGVTAVIVNSINQSVSQVGTQLIQLGDGATE